jgi:hypothetical protein
MKIEIELKTENQAFEDDQELERVLIEAVKNIASGIGQGILRDYNGNRVGQFTTQD